MNPMKMSQHQAFDLANRIRLSQGKPLTTEEMADAWWPALRDLHPVAAQAAVEDLVLNATEFVTPALVRKRTREIANRRIQGVTEPLPPSGLGPEEYQQWQRAWRDAAISGETSTARLAQAGAAAVGRQIAPASPSQGPRPTLRVGTVRPSPNAVEGVIVNP